MLAYDRPTGSSHRIDVDLDAEAVVAHAVRDDVKPSLIYEEYSIASDVVRADTGWQEALARRGITDFDLVQVDPWPAGNFGVAEEQGRRLVRVVSYVRDHDRPTTATPIRSRASSPPSTSTSGASSTSRTTAVVPVPTNARQLRHRRRRHDPHRPESRSRSSSPTARASRSTATRCGGSGGGCGCRCTRVDGLVLHTVGYEDGGASARSSTAPRWARWSCPTATPRPATGWKNAFDSGELGLGRFPFLNSLELGCDCLGEIRYFDADQVDRDAATP